MNVRNIDVPVIISHQKEMTGRDIDFKILVRDDHKFLAERKYGYFGTADIKKTFLKAIGDLTNKDLKKLCYDDVSDYLAEPFNRNLTEESIKKFILWDNFCPNIPVCRQILSKPIFEGEYNGYKL